MRFSGCFIALLSLFLSVGGLGVAGVPAVGKGGDQPSPDDLPPELPESAPAIRCPTVPKGDEGSITSVAFSPDNRAVIAGNVRGKIRWFDPATGRPPASRQSFPRWYGGACRSLALSPNGRSLLVSTAQNELSLVDVDSGSPRLKLEEIPPSKRIFFDATAFSPDGQVVAASLGNDGIALWDFATGRLRVILPPYIVPEQRIANPFPQTKLAYPAHVNSLAFTPDGKSLLSACGLVQTWDVAIGRELGRLDNPFQASGCGLALSPDGRTLAVRQTFWDDLRPGRAGRIDLWDRSSGKKLTRLPTQGHVADLIFMPDGKGLVSLEDDRIVRLWDVATAKQRAAVRFDHHNHLARLAVSPDGKRIAVGGHESDPIFGIIQLLDTDGTTLQPWKPEP